MSRPSGESRAALIPKRWLAVGEALKTRGYRIDVFWNPNGPPNGCFTARVMDGDVFAPPMQEGPIWAGAGPTVVDALDAMAVVVGRTRP